MSWFSPKHVSALATALVLSACTDPETMPGWELLGEPGLLFWIQQYYERNALEENGICTAPLLQGASRARLVEETEEELVVELAYYYSDRIRGPSDDCDRLRPGRCFMMAPCRGFNERTFTVARTPEGLRVTDMSGPQRRRTAQP